MRQIASNKEAVPVFVGTDYARKTGRQPANWPVVLTACKIVAWAGLSAAQQSTGNKDKMVQPSPS